MSDLVITPANVKASDKAHKITGVYGATITQGMVVYSDTSDSSKLKASDANASAATSKAVGIALTAGANGQPAIICYEDPEFTPGATLTVGTSYYLSSNPGMLCPNSDLGSGMYPVFVLVAYSTTQGYLKLIRGNAPIP